MNIYDFDNTIYAGDSSVDFIKYSLCHHPFLTFIGIIKALKECFKYLFKKSNLGQIKSELFSFVKHIQDLDTYMQKYITKHKHNIKQFYWNNKKDSDVIISASFDFIIKPFCEYIGVKNVIATKYDVKDGKIIGENCKGKEKVKRFRELYQDKEVMNAYSDSLSDIPMFKLAQNAYLVSKNEITKYEI